MIRNTALCAVPLAAALALCACSDEPASPGPAPLDASADAPSEAGGADQRPADAPGPDQHAVSGDPELVAYVALVAEAEQRLGLDPREMLTVLRQLYYGEAWSATSPDPLWRLVIPCSPLVGDPRPQLGDALFGELAARAETAGVDLGHVFVGLEAMTCPVEKVLIVEMPSEDFATWGGDLGAAVAARRACLALGAAAAAVSDCGGRPGGEPLDFYVAHHAPPQDLEGDLDPFAMRAALTGEPCAGSRLAKLTVDRRLSEVLGDYYLRPTSALGRARQARDRCVLELLGASVAGGAISDREAVVDRVAAQLASFAATYYTTIRDATPDAAEQAAMAADARTVAGTFLDGLLP